MSEMTKADKARAVIDAVLDGQSVRNALKSVKLDAHSLHDTLSNDRGLASRYARAMEIRADLLADEALHIADEQDDAAKARNQIQVRQWLAGKLHQKKYGDRIDLNVSATIDIGSTLAEARARLLPQCYPGQTIDGESREIQGIEQHGASDKQSPDPAPSIFD